MSGTRSIKGVLGMIISRRMIRMMMDGIQTRGIGAQAASLISLKKALIQLVNLEVISLGKYTMI